MRRLPKNIKKRLIFCLGIVVSIEEVTWLWLAYKAYVDPLPANELGANLLLSAFCVAVAGLNIVAMSAMTIYLVKKAKVDTDTALIGTLLASSITPISIVFSVSSQTGSLLISAGPYIIVTAYILFMRRTGTASL